MSALFKGVAVGSLAGLLFGFDTAVISGTTSGLTSAFQLSPGGLGLTVSSALWGTLAGALFAGTPGDRFGARDCLRAIAFLYAVSSVGCFLAPTLAWLVISRIAGGIAIGASSVLAPIYLSEIAPAKHRGAMVGSFQLNVVLGILVAYVSNYVIGRLQLGVDDWRWKFAVPAVPAMLLFGLSFSIPNSPRWLAVKGRLAEAAAVLRHIGVKDVDTELGTYDHGALQNGPGAAKSRLRWSLHRAPILLAFSIAAFNQLSGINAILYYLNDIFTAAGFADVSADSQAIVIGATNFAFTLLALTVIDRVGRKTLLIVGSFGLIASLLGTSFILLTGSHERLLLWMLIFFIASFAFSQGAVIWVYISEIFPTAVRARGQSIGSSTHWCLDAIIAAAFPLVAAHSKGAPFLFFAAAMIVQLIVVTKYFPETKGLALERVRA